MNDDALLDTLLLPNGDCIVANATKVWRYPVNAVKGQPFSEAFSEPGSPERTRQLFAGIIASAWHSGPEGKMSLDRGNPTVKQHIYSLASSYQTTHATPPMMAIAVRHYRAAGRENLAVYFEQIIREESGHDELALMDLRALGVDAQAFVDAVRPANATALANCGYQLVQSAEPVSVLGYAYALERMSLFQTEDSVAAIEAILPQGVKATRCLRVHSSVGTDAHHVDESLEFIAGLPPDERRAIALALYEAMKVMFVIEPDYPGDEAMGELIDKYSISAQQKEVKHE